MMRHGPHQGAQKSTSTGFSASITSAWKLLSVTSSRLPATNAPPVGLTSENIALAAEAQSGHFPHRLERDPGRHLRVPFTPLSKADRHLPHREALLDRPVRELDLEAVAVGVHAVQVDPLEHPPVEALEPAGEVAHVHAEQRARVPGAAARQHSPHEPPV